MMPVQAAAEPADFDAKVRQKGLRALAELLGTKSGEQSGTACADPGQHIAPDALPPYWRAALPDLLLAYQRRCAYLALYLEPATGNASVDHMQPKSRAWQLAYEWHNYRLASGFINAKKHNLALALDPFEIEPGTFALEFTAFQLKPGPAADAALAAQVLASIDLLGLNRQPCCAARQEYVSAYWAGDIRLSWLERRAPFIAQELRRQQRLLDADK